MKGKLLLFLALLIGTLVQAQLEVEIENSEEGIMAWDLQAGEEAHVGFTITNTGSTDAEWYWSIEKPEGFPEDWKFRICDSNSCYPWGFSQSSNKNPLAAGASTNPNTTYVSVKAGSAAAQGHLIFKIYATSDLMNPIFVSVAPNAVNNIEKEVNVNIFPNPTTESLGITNDENIKSIYIYNIVGKEVSVLDHTPGTIHDVSALRNGMYIVRMHDAKGDVVKATRLSKR